MPTWEDSLELVARIGYDGVELALMPDWPTSPKRFSKSDRNRLRSKLADLGLQLPAFLENLRVMHPVQSHWENAAAQNDAPASIHAYDLYLVLGEINADRGNCCLRSPGLG